MTTTTSADTGAAGSVSARAEQLAPYDAFQKAVSLACRDSGTQQALRRGLAKPVAELPARTQAALLRKGLIPYDLPDRKKQAYYAVAALIAARPRDERESERKEDEAREAESATAESPQIPAQTGAAQTPQAVPAPSTPESDGQTALTPAAPTSADPYPAPRPAWGRSLGACLAQADDRADPDSDKIRGLEARLHLLVRQDTDGLHRMLPALLRQLGSAGVTADYGRLLHDLIQWPTRRSDITTRWLEDYYRTLRQLRSSEPQTPPT
ncbi:type I-E CRISPR-associated protein Cse2/CasB [Streptomyces xiamenensis]|uniref:type I-E CRISPR-associated protein Cse2/CasB n=1 Tax=Streptomyces TaxID=1883 RepID=UPI00069442F8|nr:type I-E CRISPR-associated protein Cse2/CasB [Streptomyces sp. NRRL F-2890]